MRTLKESKTKYVIVFGVSDNKIRENFHKVDNITLEHAMNMALANEKAREQEPAFLSHNMQEVFKIETVQKHFFQGKRSGTVGVAFVKKMVQGRSVLNSVKSVDTAVEQINVGQRISGLSRMKQMIMNTSSRKMTIGRNVILTEHSHSKV